MGNPAFFWRNELILASEPQVLSMWTVHSRLHNELYSEKRSDRPARVPHLERTSAQYPTPRQHIIPTVQVLLGSRKNPIRTEHLQQSHHAVYVTELQHQKHLDHRRHLRRGQHRRPRLVTVRSGRHLHDCIPHLTYWLHLS